MSKSTQHFNSKRNDEMHEKRFSFLGVEDKYFKKFNTCIVQRPSRQQWANVREM